MDFCNVPASGWARKSLALAPVRSGPRATCSSSRSPEKIGKVDLLEAESVGFADDLRECITLGRVAFFVGRLALDQAVVLTVIAPLTRFLSLPLSGM